MGWWNRLMYSQAEQWTFTSLRGDQIPSTSGTTLEPEIFYLTVTLRSLRIVNVRRGLQRFYGAVHSFCGLPHLSGEIAEFYVVTTPANLQNIAPGNLNRVIQINQPLMGPIPYRGGALDLEVGLFSVRSTDLAGPYLSLLENLSALAGVTFISAAQPFIRPLRQGLDLLTGAADTAELEIGLAQTQNPPQTGWYAVLAAPKGSINPTTLRIDPHDFSLTDTQGSSISNYPYMVLSIDATSRRDDWFIIPDLVKPYQQLRNDVRAGRAPAIRASGESFARSARTCADLLTSDAQRIVALVNEEVNKALQPIQTSSAGTAYQLPELKDIPLYGDGTETRK